MRSAVKSFGLPIAGIVLTSAYPSLALLVANVDQVYADVAVRPLLLSMALVLAGLAGLWILLRDGHRAALLTAWASLLFFSYGHVYSLAREHALLASIIGRHRYLTPLWLVVLAAGVYGLLRVRRPERLTPILASAAAVACAWPLASLLVYLTRTGWSPPAVDRPLQQETSTGVVREGTNAALPDIYYIILDGYGRSDVLRETIGYDNRSFIGELEGLGFVVADCSLSNYAISHLSIASSMNLDYLENLHALPDPDAGDQPWIPELIQRSFLQQFLQARGYMVVAFETEYRFTELREADLFLGLKDGGSSQGVVLGFAKMYVRTTWLRAYMDSLGQAPAAEGTNLDTAQAWHRKSVLHTLDTLEHLPALRGPKFVFAHVLAPHVPYVFGSEGESVEQPDPNVAPSLEWQRQAYAAQAEYIGKRAVQIARILIAESPNPPVIVFQGDHGPDLETPVGTDEDRMSILNAYYLPGAASAVYDTITPVNSFRLVFNAVFDAGLPVLPDRSVYSSKGDPFRFHPVANACGE